MKALLNSDKLKALIATKMTYLIIFLDNNGEYAVYTGVNITGIYRYINIIGAPKIFTTLGWLPHHFVPSSSIENDTEYLHTVISDLCMTQKRICECCGSIGYKYDACIIHGP